MRRLRRPLMGAGLWAACGSTPLVAQAPVLRVEARAGVALSTVLAQADVVHEGRLEAGSATLRPGPSPFLGAALLHPVDEQLSLEFVAALSRGGLDGNGPGGRWHAGEVTVVHGTLGLRYRPRVRWLYGRAGAGLIAYHGSELAILREGSHTGLLLMGGAGVKPPVDLPLRIELELQGHSFGSVAFRREGGVDGSVARLLVGVTVGPGGER
ncbi:MAG: hypothetical protein HY704_04620 [Gemmatimonadetes bacterium]|nr:hypothetical protein [Gemmatimonadota bacterium]